MIGTREIESLAGRMTARGATVEIEYDESAPWSPEVGRPVLSVTIRNAKGIGPHAMAPIAAAERMCDFLATAGA